MCEFYACVLQVLYGTKAEIVVSSLPLVPEDNPRCWVISNKGLLIAVGYKSGTIQVYIIIYVPLILHVTAQVYIKCKCTNGFYHSESLYMKSFRDACIFMLASLQDTLCLKKVCATCT